MSPPASSAPSQRESGGSPATADGVQPDGVATAAAGPSTPPQDWAEPHPGRLLSIPFVSEPTRPAVSNVAGTFQVTGGCRGAIAAKGYSPYHNHHHHGRTLLVKRNPHQAHQLRLKFRNTMPKPLKIPDKVPEEPEQRSAPLPASRAGRTFATSPTSNAAVTTTAPAVQPLVAAVSPIKTTSPRLETTVPALEAARDADNDIEMVTVPNLDEGHHGSGAGDDGITADRTGSGGSEEMLRPVVTAASTASAGTAPLHLSDVSNHLGIIESPTIVADDEILAVVNKDVMVTPVSEEDMYGWEAELDRKLTLGYPPPNTLYAYGDDVEYDGLHHHRHRHSGADMPKRGLLQRVLSLGNIPREPSALRRRTSMGG